MICVIDVILSVPDWPVRLEVRASDASFGAAKYFTQVTILRKKRFPGRRHGLLNEKWLT